LKFFQTISAIATSSGSAVIGLKESNIEERIVRIDKFEKTVLEITQVGNKRVPLLQLV